MKRKVFAFLAPVALFCSVTQAAPNPSVVKCVKLGGKSFNVSSEMGEMGLCKLDSAMICNWTIFRHLNGRTQKAVEAYKNGFTDCGLAGGQIESVTGRKGPMKLCKFDDNSRIEEQTMVRGLQDPSNVKLNEILGLSMGN